MSMIKDFYLYFILIGLLAFLYGKILYLKHKNFKEREYFISVLNHDLRVSVLAQMRGLDLVLNSTLSSSLKDLLWEVKNSCLYSFDMITMLMNTYKYENEENILHRSDIQLKPFLDNIISKYKKIISDKNIIFSYKNCDNSVYAESSTFAKAVDIIAEQAFIRASKMSQFVLGFKNFYGYDSISFSFTPDLYKKECSDIFKNNQIYSAVGHGIKIYLAKKIIEFHGGKLKTHTLNNNLIIFTIEIPSKDKNKRVKKPTFCSIQPQV